MNENQTKQEELKKSAIEDENLEAVSGGIWFAAGDKEDCPNGFLSEPLEPCETRPAEGALIIKS